MRAGPGADVPCEIDRRTGTIIRERGHEGGDNVVRDRGNDEILSDVFFPEILPGGIGGGFGTLPAASGRRGSQTPSQVRLR